jgi:hypothetical protein
MAWVATSGQKVANSFIFAEQQEVCELNKLTSSHTLKTLMAVYFCFDRNYPLCSNFFFEFLDSCLFDKIGFKGNGNYLKVMSRFKSQSVSQA